MLGAAGVPKAQIRALQKIYEDNRYYLKWNGAPRCVFQALSGVRQGCPLSATIYVIVTDSIIRFLLTRLSPWDCLRAYADDLEIVLGNV